MCPTLVQGSCNLVTNYTQYFVRSTWTRCSLYCIIQILVILSTFDRIHIHLYFHTSLLLYFSTSLLLYFLLSTSLLFFLSTCIFQHNLLVQSDPNLPQSKEKAGPGQSSQSGWNRNTQRDYPRSLEGTSLRKNKITSSFSQLLQYEGNYPSPTHLW